MRALRGRPDDDCVHSLAEERRRQFDALMGKVLDSSVAAIAAVVVNAGSDAAAAAEEAGLWTK